jgi:poly(3-hydroxybutyrate) depolymerase
MPAQRFAISTLSVVVLALMVARAQESRRPATAAGAGERCTTFASEAAAALKQPALGFESTALNAARTAQGNAPAWPEHCEAIGRLNERTGFNSQRYAIRFHLRLPTQWNGRFFFEGGGGTNGNLGQALGNLQGSQATNALTLGYAVVSQDSGHDNTVNNDPNLNGNATFGFDPQARLDYGYNSYDQVTRTAKALVRAYYGRAPERSYYVGCSEGGREGMLMTQKFPDHFDGVLACAPGFNIPKAALAQTWNFQSFAQAARAGGLYDRHGQPFVNKAFSDEDLALVSNAILDACDALDGAKDGMVAGFMECGTPIVRPRLAALICKGPKRANCLKASQVAALERVMGGPRDGQGNAIYSDWAWDAGLGGHGAGEAYYQGWRIWSLGDYEAESTLSITTGLVALSSASLSNPPVAVKADGPASAEYLLSLDVSDARLLNATSRPLYPQSPNEFIAVASTDLSGFKRRGGKLLIAHGVSDPVFSVKDSIRWWTALNDANNGAAADFSRVFPVPGMNHCAGGPATDQFDAFTALVAWVEKGTAPDQIVAKAGPNTPWPGRTRPLCAYPKIARYKGTGSLEDAASFECR